MRFDVSVDLTSALLPPGAPAAPAIEKARSAVGSLPGAEHVSVEDCRGAPTTLRWVTPYVPGRSAPMWGGEWEAVRERVAAAVAAALA